MYAVQATIEYRKYANETRAVCVKQLPTFYLDERVQGITCREHAERVALDIIDPAKTLLKVNMHVEKV